MGQESNNLAAIGSLRGYRSLRWGRHLDLIITDERSYRTEDPFGRPEMDALDDKDFRQFTAQEVIDILDGGRGYNNGKPPETIRAGEKEIPTELTGSPFAAGTNISALASRPGGVILLASDAGNNKVLGFQIQNNGALSPLPGFTVAAGTQPGALTFTFNDFVYVANRSSNNVSAYKFDFATSTLTPIAGSPFATGTSRSRLAPQDRYSCTLPTRAQAISPASTLTRTPEL